MMGTLLVCCAVLGAGRGEGTTPAGSPADATAYERARKEVGRDAGAHVRLALWCEARGMSAERMRHLALAVMYDPSNTLARALMGLVAYQGKWGRPEEVGKRIQDDPAYRRLVEEYLQRRARAASTPDAQMKLASWCDENGLKAQALAHYSVVVQLDPSHESAWRRMGYQKLGGRRVKPEEAAAERLEAQRQRHADKQWRPRLERIRDDLEGSVAARRSRALRALEEVTDPRAVPMIWAVFIAGGVERRQVAAVQMLGQIEGTASSTALATLAILGPQGVVRARAAETLMRRDPRDIVGRLIGLVRKPFTYKVRPIEGPGATGELFVEGETFNVRRIYRSRGVEQGLIPSGSLAPTADGLVPASVALSAEDGGRVASPREIVFDPLAEMVAHAYATADTKQEVRAAQRLEVIRRDNQAQRERLAADVREIDAMNARIRDLNARVLPILATLTGRDIGAEPEQWKGWWTDQLGYAFQKQSQTSKPTFTDVVDSPSWSASLECFAAGTPVHTIDGPRAIESIRIGDRVLSQDTATGALGFQPVLAIHQTPAAATVRVRFADGEAIVATGIHRFWRAGQGWATARDLKPGDRIRAIGAVVEVRAVDAADSQPVFNLDVAEHHDFLVGRKGLLVHDSDFVRPVPAPFDRGTNIAATPTREE